MSAPKIEDTKPSKWIALFWWVVFIVPVAFLWVSTQSYLYVGALIGLRVAIMFIPKFRNKTPQEKTQPQHSEIVNTHATLLTSYKEELADEWKGLLKLLRIYNYDTEDKYLENYRKLRGWDR